MLQGIGLSSCMLSYVFYEILIGQEGEDGPWRR